MPCPSGSEIVARESAEERFAPWLFGAFAEGMTVALAGIGLGLAAPWWLRAGRPARIEAQAAPLVEAD